MNMVFEEEITKLKRARLELEKTKIELEKIKTELELEKVKTEFEKAKLFIISSIFLKTKSFSFNEIYEETNKKIKSKNIYIGNIIGKCIDELFKSGFLNKVENNRYRVKDELPPYY